MIRRSTIPARTPRHRRAFTLIEAVLSALIVGVSMVPALQMLGSTAVDRRAHADLARGIALAESLMGEIVQCKYSTGSAISASRITWTELSDYNASTESPPTNRDGTVIPGYTGWTRAASVTFATLLSPDTTSATDTGLRKIIVTVTSPDGKVYTLSALRSSGGICDRTASASATFPSAVTISLQSSTGDPISAGINLPNQIP